jgi:adenylate kinase family enzyme
MQYRRILIYGVTGSGKTTLAKRLSRITGIPCHLVDDLAYTDNWTQTSDEFQTAAILDIVRQDEWILDTAYGKWVDIPLQRAELIVGLDYPRHVSLARLLRRTVTRIVTGEPVCNNNRESLRLQLSRQSIILWHFKSFSRKRSRMRSWSKNPSARILLFDSPRKTEAWLRSLTQR